MKNIHLLKTQKPSRLFYDISIDKLVLGDTAEISKWFQNFYLYITNDETIKRDWFISLNDDESFMEIIKNNEVDDFSEYADEDWVENCEKIILTTDPKLIEDGVQSIDDEFLEWFVKNPSCEEVKVKLVSDEDWSDYHGAFENSYYKIIISKEEPKEIIYYCKQNDPYCVSPNCRCNTVKIEDPKPVQVLKGQGATFVSGLEEASKKYIETSNYMKLYPTDYITFGAKWQQEQDTNKYSEEEVKQMFNRYNEFIAHHAPEEWQLWIDKQFKKK